jgi:hypothetical protein
MIEQQSFSPAVKIGPATVTPPGWMWLLGFAMGGCDWAIQQASTPEFKAQVRAHLEAQKQLQVDEQMVDLDKRLTELKAQRTAPVH